MSNLLGLLALHAGVVYFRGRYIDKDVYIHCSMCQVLCLCHLIHLALCTGAGK